jgi:hypothetical protein
MSACPRPGWSSSWCRPTARSRCATAARTSRRATGARPEATAEAFRRRRLLLHRRRRGKWIDPQTDIHLGLKFDGRIAEDFKLATGTFVSVGPLRAQDHRRRRTLCAGRGAHRHEPEGSRRAGVPHRRRARSSAAWAPTAAVARGAASAPVQAHFQQVVDDGWPQRHRQRQPHRAAACAGRAAVHRQGRGHRQGLDQPARRAQAPRRRWSQALHDGTLPQTLNPRSQRHQSTMNIQGQAALVTGGGIGPRRSHRTRTGPPGRQGRRAGRQPAALAEQVAAEIGGVACQCDITSTDSVVAALAKAAAAHGPARILMNIAGIGTPSASSAKDGTAAPLEDFARVINVNLIGSYNISRLFAAECAQAAAAGRRRARRDGVHRVGGRL